MVISIKWILLVLFTLLAFLQCRLWIGEGSIKELFRLKQMIRVQSEEVERLLERNERLDAEVQALKNSPEALEERARSELGMIKQNETFCVVVEPN